jgi:hypothetical protein
MRVSVRYHVPRGLTLSVTLDGLAGTPGIRTFGSVNNMAREPEAIAGLRRALGERLATFRKAAELTQGQLAKATFCDRSQVAHLEGVGRPTTLLAAQAGAGEAPDAMAAVPSPEAAVAASQERWRSVRGHLIGGHGTTLAKQAAGLYGATRGLPRATTVIALPSWMPSEPVPIKAMTLEWSPRPLGLCWSARKPSCLRYCPYAHRAGRSAVTPAPCGTSARRGCSRTGRATGCLTCRSPRPERADCGSA